MVRWFQSAGYTHLFSVRATILIPVLVMIVCRLEVVRWLPRVVILVTRLCRVRREMPRLVRVPVVVLIVFSTSLT